MRSWVRAGVAGVVGVVLAMALTGSALASQPTDEMLDSTNTHRSAHDGQGPLLCSAALDAIAQAWTLQMAAEDTLHHNPNLTAQAPAGWSRLGENVAWNRNYPNPVQQLVTQWIDSPGHHANMASPYYTHMGVGYYVDGNGKSWGTQVFGQYSSAKPDPTRVTVTGTFLNSALQPLAGLQVTATTSGGSASAFVGPSGRLCVTVPPGAGTVTLSTTSGTIATLGGASAGGVLDTYYVEPNTAGVGAPGVQTQTPQRLLDAQGLELDVPLCFTVTGRAGVPANATGVLLNATAAQPTSGGNALVYPDSNLTGHTPAPNASTVNFESGRDVANSAFVAIPANGKICVAVRGSSPGRFILDVSGYVTAEAQVVLSGSTRLMDTRGGADHVGALSGPLAAGATSTVSVAGSAGVPGNATAVIANVTVTGVSGPGHLKVWAHGAPMPNTSVINYASGQDKANAQVIQLGAGGAIDLQSVASSAHVIIDIMGYLTADSLMVPVAPTRVVETRANFGQVGPISGSLVRDSIYAVNVAQHVPAGATAVVLNVTAVQPESFGHLRVYPDAAGTGQTSPPSTSTLNYIPGRDIPNSAVVQVPPDGLVDFYSSAAGTHLVVDLVGYVVAPD